MATATIKEAMLAGSPERGSVIARMAAVLGDAQPWVHECADAALARFGASWAGAEIDALAALLADAPAFVRAWYGDRRPTVIRIVRRPPVQQPLPAPLAAAHNYWPSCVPPRAGRRCGQW